MGRITITDAILSKDINLIRTTLQDPSINPSDGLPLAYKLDDPDMVKLLKSHSANGKKFCQTLLSNPSDTSINLDLLANYKHISNKETLRLLGQDIRNSGLTIPLFPASDDEKVLEGYFDYCVFLNKLGVPFTDPNPPAIAILNKAQTTKVHNPQLDQPYVSYFL
jgi:hypothetical protein